MRHVIRVLTPPLDSARLLGRPLREYVDEAPVPEGAFVVLDALCPLVPAEFVADLVERVRVTGRPHVGVRPVTDTVKAVHDGLVGETVDRQSLWQLAAPVVLAEPVEVPGSLAELVATLPEPVLVEAPALARRVTDAAELSLLEALATALGAGARQPQSPPGRSA